MSATRIGEVVLINTTGNHRKAYRVWLEAEGALYHVGFAYGRIGQRLREGRKTTAGVGRALAEVILSEIVGAKEARGYEPQRAPSPATQAATAAASGPPQQKAEPKARQRTPAASPRKTEDRIPVNRTGRTIITF